jgi:hypothetical protein
MPTGRTTFIVDESRRDAMVLLLGAKRTGIAWKASPAICKAASLRLMASPPHQFRRTFSDAWLESG